MRWCLCTHPRRCRRRRRGGYMLDRLRGLPHGFGGHLTWRKGEAIRPPAATVAHRRRGRAGDGLSRKAAARAARAKGRRRAAAAADATVRRWSHFICKSTQSVCVSRGRRRRSVSVVDASQHLPTSQPLPILYNCMNLWKSIPPRRTGRQCLPRRRPRSASKSMGRAKVAAPASTHLPHRSTPDAHRAPGKDYDGRMDEDQG